jgi:hypothetical protein
MCAVDHQAADTRGTAELRLTSANAGRLVHRGVACQPGAVAEDALDLRKTVVRHMAGADRRA